AKPHREKTAAECFDLGADLCPGPALPDAAILFAVGRPVRPQPRMLEQQLRKGVGRAQRHQCSWSAVDPLPPPCARGVYLVGSPLPVKRTPTTGGPRTLAAFTRS